MSTRRTRARVAAVSLVVVALAACDRAAPPAAVGRVADVATAAPTALAPAEQPPSLASIPAPRWASARPQQPPASAAPRPAVHPSSATARATTAPTRSAATSSGRSLAAYRGLGTWVDAYDFADELGGRLSPDAVATMAARGITTLYIQAAKEDDRTPHLLLSASKLGEFLTQAHAHGLRVVGWYLPQFVDPARDWAHLQAMLDFRASGQRFDSVGLDIESREQTDVDLRNTRLVALAKKLRAATSLPLSGIVLPPVVTDVINKAYWPAFPWAQIKSSFDVWQPMDYWTNRTKDSGYRDAYRYTKDNDRLLRGHLGAVRIHVAGGIGDKATTADYRGMIRAAREDGALGVSVYDYATTAEGAYPTLRTSPS